MAGYYAITQRESGWVAVSAGNDPEQVYRDAVLIIQGQGLLPEDEDVADVSPAAEQQLDALRVVPDSIARETYHVVPAAMLDD
jgi:hypothetical protein